MERQLYPGIPFSPQATLANNIGAADTIIEVSDVSAFPPAPNLATIGTDEEGETILYAAKTATALSGCQRGVEGTPKAWTAGELIGRNFTAKDHKDLIAFVKEIDEEKGKPDGIATLDKNGKLPKSQLPDIDKCPTEGSANPVTSGGVYDGLEKKQDKLTGSVGQLIGIGESGAEATVYQSNQNLLDNWYFIGGGSQQGGGQFPINQMGKTEYRSNVSSYTIDRWKSGLGFKISFTEEGIKIIQKQSGGRNFQQLIDNPSVYAGRTLTATILVSEIIQTEKGAALSIITNSQTTILASNINAPGLYSGTIVIPEEISNIKFQVEYKGENENYFVITAAKLELGPVQTLAHKEGNEWVLNDPPPNYALELAKCQMYQRVLQSKTSYYAKAVGWCSSEGNIYFILPLEMRNSNPTIISSKPDNSNIILENATKKKSISSITNISAVQAHGGISIHFTVPSDEAEKYDICVLRVTSEYLLIDNNL